MESQKGAIDKFVLKRVEEPSKRLSVENIDVDTIINDFVSRNARRQYFL